MSSDHATLDFSPRRVSSNASLLERRATPSTVSSSKRGFSAASSETGESSAAASNRNSLSASNDGLLDGMAEKNDPFEGAVPARIGKGSHRSHRSRNGGGFLLSNSVFEPPPGDAEAALEHTAHRPSSKNRKGKSVVRIEERKQTKKRSDTALRLGVGNSPLGATVTTAGTDNGLDGDTTEDVGNHTATKAKGIGLDVDSTQIVNLALNLSESRRNAARRSLSAAAPPISNAFGESFTGGGSLRQHLQQQRRSSRNLSPKSERVDRSLTASPRIGSSQKIHSPLHTSFDTEPDGGYRYHFTASTLARAEKAKNAIGLMAEYRRLLQYVPPLKPQGIERATTATSSESPLASLLTPSRTAETSSSTPRQLGRQYNPLQYIRNRKVRARERKSIDAEAQGFEDLARVSSWVDQVAAEALSNEYQEADCLPMPPISKAEEVSSSPRTSPQAKSQNANPKVKRPRIDWVTNPADMIADLFWMEQDDNKKMIEDRSGRKIFPPSAELKRPPSRRDGEPEPQETPGLRVQKSPDLRIDTKLPEFRSLKGDSDRHFDSVTSRAKQRLRDATRIHHGHNGSVRELHLLRARSPSDSDSSDTDGVHHPRRKRSGTADSRDRGKDILEKQMMEVLEREMRQQEWSVPHGSIESQTDGPLLVGSSSRGHSRSGSFAAKANRQRLNSMVHDSSGRPSLEVPPLNPRGSLEELDSTAPNSPQTKACQIANTFVPSIAMDLSPPPRQISPTRHHMSKVRSRINPFHEHSRTDSRGRKDTLETPVSAPPLSRNEMPSESPETPERRKRSMSPAKKISTRKTDDSSKSSGKASVRKGKGGDEPSSFRGLFKATRGPVARVSDFLWRKESSPITGTSSGFSTDESDVEDLRATKSNVEKYSRENSAEPPSDDNDDALALKGKEYSHIRMPVFISSTERHGRHENVGAGIDTSSERQAREERRKSSRANLLEVPPRIDIQHASPSSPELEPSRRYSSVSDLESRRGSLRNGVESADARLNAILGFPGRRSSNLPVTGLSSLETTHGKRPTLEGNRQWSISDRGVSPHRGPMTKREIARVRALLLSSGIKAKEISRRAAETKDLCNTDEKPYSDIAKLAHEKVNPVQKSEQHLLAARIISDDIQLSSRMWQATADSFCNTTVQEIIGRVDHLHSIITDNLTPMVRTAGDEADEVSKDLVTSQTLQVKRIIDTMDKMMRRRRRRFRWLRRGGWVIVEWALVGVMWFVWFLVVFTRIAMGLGKAVVGSVRWLLWL